MNPRVLIVDDDPAAIEMLELTCPQECIVKSTKSAIKGLQIMESIRPDVVLLDLGMPDVDGFEFIDLLREDARWTHVRVLVVSGHDSPDVRVKVYEHGADDFIAKPFSPGEFARKIRRWAHIKRTSEISQLRMEFLNLIHEQQSSPFAVVAHLSELFNTRGSDPDEQTDSGIIATDAQCRKSLRTLEFKSELFLKRLDLLQEYSEWRLATKEYMPISFALVSLVRPLMSLWEAACHARQISLTVGELPEEAMVTVDPKSTKRIIRWLVNNAFEHARDEIKLEGGVMGTHHIYLDIIDDGVGFDDDVRPHLFTGFEPGQMLNTEHEIGLHLSLINEMLLNQGGSISILDPGPDTTTVRLLLPT